MNSKYKYNQRYILSVFKKQANDMFYNLISV